ncbi:MAG: tRNA (guanosine(37)-N1)-methyltransferase TrmD, partial [Clostridia bacterium]|nr:tRNA (guanosine(37)-N1)-methyltransferase TrmD [Clostridia bacterium]
MKIKILTIFPEMFESVMNASILGRAREQGLIEVECIDIRPFSDRKHKNTDDYPFGGGAGMVMLAQPIMDAMTFALGENFHGRRIYMGPRGTTLT